MKRGVVPISLGMVSVFLINGEKPILVDTGYPKSQDLIIEKLEELGIDPQEIELIVITHAHEDHMGSAAALKEISGAKIAVHKNDAKHLKNGSNSELVPRGILARLMSLTISNKKINGVEPDIIIEDNMDLNEFGVKGKVVYTPGHTSGSLSIVLETGEIIIGDLLMAFFPKDKPKLPIFLHSVSDVKESIGKVLGCSPKNIYASHGGPFDPDALRKFLK